MNQEDIRKEESKAIFGLTTHPGWHVLKGILEEEQLREMKHILNGKKEDLIWKRIGYVNGLRKVLQIVEARSFEHKENIKTQAG